MFKLASALGVRARRESNHILVLAPTQKEFVRTKWIGIKIFCLLFNSLMTNCTDVRYALAKSSANSLVGTVFVSHYQLQHRVSVLKTQ